MTDSTADEKYILRIESVLRHSRFNCCMSIAIETSKTVWSDIATFSRRFWIAWTQNVVWNVSRKCGKKKCKKSKRNKSLVKRAATTKKQSYIMERMYSIKTGLFRTCKTRANARRQFGCAKKNCCHVRTPVCFCELNNPKSQTIKLTIRTFRPSCLADSGYMYRTLRVLCTDSEHGIWHT